MLISDGNYVYPIITDKMMEDNIFSYKYSQFKTGKILQECKYKKGYKSIEDNFPEFDSTCWHCLQWSVRTKPRVIVFNNVSRILRSLTNKTFGSILYIIFKSVRFVINTVNIWPFLWTYTACSILYELLSFTWFYLRHIWIAFQQAISSGSFTILLSDGRLYLFCWCR